MEYFEGSTLDTKDIYLKALEGVEVSGMKKEDLTFGDFLYISVLRRISSVGEGTVIIKSNCPSCGDESTYKLEIQKIDFNELKATSLPVNFKLANGNGVISFKPMTIGQYLKWLAKDFNESEQSSSYLASQCISMDFDKALEVIKALNNSQDLQNINRLNELLSHEMSPLNFECKSQTSSCKAWTISLDEGGVGAIVEPFRTDDGLEDSAFSFG